MAVASATSKPANDSVLGDVFSVFGGTVPPRLPRDRLGKEGPCLLRPGDLLASGPIEGLRLLDSEAHDQLAAGDLCIAAVRSRTAQPLQVRCIEDSDLPVVADQNVLVARPKSNLPPEQREFFVQYLRSRRAASLLAALVPNDATRLRPEDLIALPLPAPEETLLSALADLQAAKEQLQDWSEEVETAREALMSEKSGASVLALRSQGQRLRQRVSVARQLDDAGYRFRTLFPFPLALSWRRVQSASRDLEGYQGLLECAEALTGYLAALAILLSRSASVELAASRTLREKLETTPHGATLGDWNAIVREVAGRKFRHRVARDAPLIELTELFVADTAADKALRELTTSRNAQAHNRGPKGMQVPAAFDTALASLKQLFLSCQWLSDYPLRLVTDTTWDDFRNEGEYSYRELMGDHYLVQERRGHTPVSTLNRGRLYIADRAGQLHLLSPLIEWHTCPDCGLPAAFLVDQFAIKEQACQLRALDHNHTIDLPGLTSALRHVGLLSPSP